MKSILVVFNGITFPFYLMEYAVEQAKSNAASLHVLFVTAKGETEEGYGFPSDLAAAETVTDTEDAKRNDEAILKDYMKLAKDTAASENVTCVIERKMDSSLSDIMDFIEGFDVVYLDAAFDETTAMLPIKRFSLNDLVKHAGSSLQIVSARDLDK